MEKKYNVKTHRLIIFNGYHYLKRDCEQARNPQENRCRFGSIPKNTTLLFNDHRHCNYRKCN